MRVSLVAMTALVAGAFAQHTCPAAATTTVFVTVGSAKDPVPSVVIQTVIATVLPPVEPTWSPASPSIPATLTVTIDSYGPPTGGSQFTGPKPWESSLATSAAFTVVTATVFSPGTNTPVGNPAEPTGSDATNGQDTPTGSTLSVGQSPPGFPWNPAKTATTDCSSITAVPVGSDSNPAGVTVITTTLFRNNATPGQATPSVDTVVASFTVTFPRPTATDSVPGSALTSGIVVPNSAASGRVFTYTVPAPNVSDAPSGAGNDPSVTSFTTTLYHTRPASGQGTPVIDTLVTCFTVTFPSATGIVPAVTGVPTVTVTVPGGASDVTVGTTTRYVPTMVPGPDGQLSYSVQTLVSTFTAPLAGSPSTAGTSIITVVVPADPIGTILVNPANPSSAPAGGVATVFTTTLYDAPSSSVVGSQSSLSPQPPVVILTLTVPQPPVGTGPTNPYVSPNIPGNIGSAGASSAAVVTTTIFQTAPGPVSSVNVPGGTNPTSVPGGYGDVVVIVPGSAGIPVSGVPASGVVAPGAYPSLPSAGSGTSPGSVGAPFTASISVSGIDPTAANELPGGYGQTGIPSLVSRPASTLTVVQPIPVSGGVAGGAASVGGGYGSVIVVPTTLATTLTTMPEVSPSVITLWPVDSSAGAALPGAATKTSCSTALITDVASTAVLTSTLVNVVADATTTYTFPYESLVTVVNTSTAAAATDAATATDATVSTAAITDAISASTWQSVVVQSSVIVQSTGVQVFTTGAFTTVVQSPGIMKRYINSTTAVPPVPTPMCTGTTEVGNLNLDFDDVPHGPIYNPYHRFWFSKGFLAGPPPLMPFLPSSGGRLVEYVPPVLSNSTSDDAFSGDTAQIGMGSLASSPCFRFDFFGMNLGCHSDLPGQLCLFTFTGYAWDADNSREKEVVSQDAWVNACTQSADCLLTPFSATGFAGLSSILVTLRVDGRPQVWWGDDLRVGWSRNDCDTAACRQQFEPEVSKHHGPTWYWTPSGLRVLSPSRINKYYLG
ncbi:hypothetical protein EsH8_VI_000773 [Colletotrichum jinshuiense]